MLPELTSEQTLAMIGNMRTLLERYQIYIEDLEHQVEAQQIQLQQFFEQNLPSSGVSEVDSEELPISGDSISPLSGDAPDTDTE